MPQREESDDADAGVEVVISAAQDVRSPAAETHSDARLSDAFVDAIRQAEGEDDA